MPISPGSTLVHIRGMIPCTSVLSQVFYYTYETNVQQDKEKERKLTRWQWIHAHQSRSATYTSSRVPCSLFKTACLCWMYQLSSMQCLVVCWWWSSTSDWLRSTACPVLNTCSAKAGIWTSPFFSARRCLLTCCLRLLPVWLMYTLEHFTQEMEYTTPLRSSTSPGLMGMYPLSPCFPSFLSYCTLVL